MLILCYLYCYYLCCSGAQVQLKSGAKCWGVHVVL